MKFDNKLCLATAAMIIAAGAGQIHAANVTLNLGNLSGSITNTGTLASESDAVLESFTLTVNSPLTVFTTSYGGGNNLNGSKTAAGGFQSNVSLFTTSGIVVDQTTGSDPMATADPATGMIGDSYFNDPSVAAGSYILAITNWGTIGDPVNGFTNAYGSGGFADVGGNARSGNYTLNISAAATPEPGSFWLTLPAFAVAFGLFRRRSHPAVGESNR